MKTPQPYNVGIVQQNVENLYPAKEVISMELLCPAGSMASLKIAIAEGADAVYV